jgi:hypothetical protein
MNISTKTKFFLIDRLNVYKKPLINHTKDLPAIIKAG